MILDNYTTHVYSICLQKHNAIIQDLLANSLEESKYVDELCSKVASDERLSEPTVRQNVLNDESFFNQNTLDKSLSEPLFRKNVLLDERKTEPHSKHYEPVTNYKKLYEELLQKYEAKSRENAELIRRNEELVKIIKETERHNFTQGMLSHILVFTHVHKCLRDISVKRF